MATTSTEALNQESEDACIRQSLAHADPNVLRIVLLQLTGDPALLQMRVQKRPIRGGILMLSVLADEHHAEVRQRMFDYLKSQSTPAPAAPPKERQAELMEVFIGRPLSDVESRFGQEELALSAFPRQVEWSRKPPAERLTRYPVCIVGAGISGIVTAVQLEHLGIPYTIIERLDEVGGTWAVNNYPGVRVDVNAFLYQFRFVKQYPWTEFFPQGGDIKRYLNHVVDEYAIRPHIQLGTEVGAATWDEQSSQWRITLRHKDGRQEALSAAVLVSASGLFNKPKVPNIPGLDTFEGTLCYTATWDHGFDPRGKRVALIGNGSSGTQIMPVLAEKAGQLTVYQRTPQWIAEMENYKTKISPQLQWVIDKVPYYWNWLGYAIFSAATQLQNLQTFDQDWQASGGKISEGNDKLRSNLTSYIAQKLGNPDLIAKSTPTYAPLARRPVVDNGWYDALRRDTVELVTEGIERITPDGILSEDGVERRFDGIVLATGFEVSKYMWPVKYRGRKGVTLEEQWNKDGARAYLGMTMPNFPNLFIFYGPNGQPRAGGFYSWAEIWSRYVVKSIVALIEGEHLSMEVRQEVFEDYNKRLDTATKSLIWETEGAGGYYVNEKGRSGVNMPWRIEDYYSMVEEPTLSDFILA